jgi:site-specific recombinase XerD
MTEPDLRVLLESWSLHLRAERKAKETLKSYRTGVLAFLAWCEKTHTTPALSKPLVNGWIADLLDAGAEGTTAVNRQLAVRRFSGWCADEGEIPMDLLLGMHGPKIDRKVVPSLTLDQLGALIAACAGKGFRDRRDEALVRFMAESGARASETASMLKEMPDLDLASGTAIVRRGKGGKGRVVPFGAQTIRAIDRYVRMRRTHRLADTSALWLGDRGKGFGYQALYDTLTWRADIAKIEGFHPHILRHTAATRWLEAGGSEGGLMAVAGWARRDMIERYTGATATARAVKEARGLKLGEI